MQAFRQNVTRIKGLSDRRRMPLMGKIRLGIKKKSTKSGKEYPHETDYFVVPPEVEQVFGDKPKSLEIMFPMNDIDAVFPCAYIWYGQSKGVKCKGDGEVAYCANEKGEIVTKPCPCENLETGACKQVGRLLFMIPKVSVAGVYQISTSSFNSIVDIQSGLDYVQAMVGRFAFIQLELKRVPTVTHHQEKRQTHYTIQLTLPEGFNVKALADLKADNERIYTQAQYQLPAPVDENPEMDAVDEVTDEEDEVVDAKPDAIEEDPLNDNPPGDIENLLATLNEYSKNDNKAYLAGKRNARITKKPQNLTPEEIERWLQEIEAFIDTRSDHHG